MKRKITRTYRKTTTDERKYYDELHAKLDAERAETAAWANAVLDGMEKIEGIVAALRAARIAKGISLSQVEEASGLGRANVSRLENAEHPNPTLETLLTYAAALGVELRVALVDKAEGKMIELPAA